MKRNILLQNKSGIILPAFFIWAALLLLSCEPAAMEDPALEMNAKVNVTEVTGKSAHVYPHKEIADLRSAVAHLRDFEKAQTAGYAIELTPYVSQMGFHYLNASLLDETFQVTEPEVLMFVPGANGEKRFVGVEYAVPIMAMNNPQPAPEGFPGNADEWSINTQFNVWTLHVWVGSNNPNGIFAPHNPLLP